MELPEVGKHCAIKDCAVLDFLPFHCHLCKSDYCANHRAFDHHKDECPGRKGSDNRAIVCPVCSQPIPGVSTFAVKENPFKVNWLVDKHIKAGCPSDSSLKKAAKTCCFSNCNKVELIPFKCKECQSQFCSKHRLVMDHACASTLKKSRLQTTRA